MADLGPDWTNHAIDTSSESEHGMRRQPAWTADGQPACDICGGAGYVRLSRPIGHPDFGRAEPCRCMREEEAARHTERLQRLSNLGPLQDARLSAESLQRGSATQACAFADAPDTDDDGGVTVGDAAVSRETRQPVWLALLGEPGSGRTQLAAELANRRIAAGRPALYFVAADLLDRLRAAMGASNSHELSYALLFEYVRDAPFLILDDLDCVSPTDWAREKLFQLLNHRRNRRLRTVLIATESAGQRVGESLGLQAFFRSGRDLLRIDLSPADLDDDAYTEFGGIGRDVLARFSFDGFRSEGAAAPGEECNLSLIKSVVMEWAASPRGWLTLCGSAGTGKTHLAAAAANVRLMAGDRVCFAVVPDLLDALRASYREDAEAAFGDVFQSLKQADLLVLDDLGAQAATEWAREKLYQLCATRHLRGAPTLVTTNLMPDDLDPRLASRLLDHQISTVYRVKAPDYRTGAAPEPVQGSAPAARRRSPRRGRR